MKKLFCLIALGAFVTANAQDSAGTNQGSRYSEKSASKLFSWSIGVEPSVPLGHFSDYTSFGLGGSLQGEYRPGRMLGITLNFGDIDYFGKTVNGVKYSDFNYLPLMAGLKLYLADKLYIHGQAGPGFGTNGLGTSFWYGGGIGINIVGALDAEVKYTGWHQNEVNMNGSGGVYGGGNGGYSGSYGGYYPTIGLRVAYTF